MDLHPVEVEVLKTLRSIKSQKDLKEIAKETGIDYYKLYKGCLWLSEKGLVTINKIENECFEYTEYGKKCLEIGLPEERLIKEINENGGEIHIKNIKTLEKKELNATIGLLKRLGYIELNKGKIKLLKDKLEWNIKSFDNPVLIENKIIEKVKKTKYFVDLTEKGKTIELKEVINLITPEILVKKSWKGKDFRKFDLKKEVPKKIIGRFHYYNEFLEKIREWLISRGFKEMKPKGLIIPEFYNFDLLYQPQNHPARDWTDTYSVNMKYKFNNKELEVLKRVKEVHENGWKMSRSIEKASKMMPRAHVTALSAQTLFGGIEIPGKYFAVGWVTRPDDFDASHDVEFHQLEGFVASEDVSFRELLGMLKDLSTEALGLKDAKVKFWPDYFPFTEPSVQISIKHPKFGWLELGGAGIFREEVTKPVGIDVPVIAWGLGLGRLAMLKLGLTDIRDLHTYDIDLIR